MSTAPTIRRATISAPMPALCWSSDGSRAGFIRLESTWLRTAHRQPRRCLRDGACEHDEADDEAGQRRDRLERDRVGHRLGGTIEHCAGQPRRHLPQGHTSRQRNGEDQRGENRRGLIRQRCQPGTLASVMTPVTPSHNANVRMTRLAMSCLVMRSVPPGCSRCPLNPGNPGSSTRAASTRRQRSRARVVIGTTGARARRRWRGGR